MPIRPPALDDRSFADLAAEMVRRVPAHTPEWTDLREGDPGRTLIDLFAWMGDTILYRANLIPERQRLAFLRLLGKPLRPALAARGLVQVRIDDPAITNRVILPPRHAIAKPVPFEMEGELPVLPVESRIYIKRRPNRRETADMAGLLAELRGLYGLSGPAQPYVTTEIFTNAEAEAGGRDVIGESTDSMVWVALLAPAPDEATRDAVRATLGGDADNRRVSLSIGLAPTIEAPAALEAISTPSPIAHVWEIATAAPDGLGYLPLEVLSDGTGGLVRTGVVRVLLPGADDFGVPSNDVLEQIAAGVGDRPPRIDDPVTAARLVAWLRLRPLPAARAGALRLSWLGTNAAMVVQRQSLDRLQIGVGNGLSGQRFALGASNVDLGTLTIEVEEDEGMRIWPMVPDVALARPGERACAVDSEAGSVLFGNGVHGAVPATGRAIHASGLRTTSGAAGNLAQGSMKGILAPDPAVKLKLMQPLPITGGADAELLEDAEVRIPAELRNAHRAVTRNDYVALARATPGLAIARVEVLEKFKPQQRRDGLPGVVSVMVLPARTGTEKPAPRPSRAMLETVHGWLDVRRPIGTELYIIAPDYIPIGVSAAVQVVDPAQREAVLDAVAQTIRLHLWPLPPGGPDGQGWPLGRALDDRLIETAIARVPGVRSVAPVRLFTRHRSGAWRPIAEDVTGRGMLSLARWQLPELDMLSVVEGDIASPSLPPAAGSAGSNAIAVPIVPELC